MMKFLQIILSFLELSMVHLLFYLIKFLFNLEEFHLSRNKCIIILKYFALRKKITYLFNFNFYDLRLKIIPDFHYILL